MSVIIEDPNLIFLLLSLLIGFILFQIYLVFKIKLTVQKILEIFIKIDSIVKELQWKQTGKTQKIIRTCQNCKNRIVYFHSENESYFYIKCRLNNQIVNPDDFCHYFVLDPQSYEI